MTVDPQEAGDSNADGTQLTPVDSPSGAVCANCQTHLQGDICHVCGQKASSPLRHFAALGEDALDAFFEFDSRLFRTLPALFLRPGYLTHEYFAGRRVRYLPPFRATFLLSVLAFFAIQFNVDVNNFNVNISTANAYSSATTPAQVRQQLAASLADLKKADTRNNPIAAAGIQAAREEFKRMAATRIKALQKGTAADSDPDVDIPLPAWPGRISAAASLKDLQNRVAQADLAITRQQKQLQSSDKAHKKLDTLQQQVFLAAGQRMSQLQSGLVGHEAAADADQTSDFAGLDFLGAGFTQRLKSNATLLKTDGPARQRFVAAVFNILPPTLFVLLPIFALLLKIMYLFKRRLYIEHLMVALHSHAFIFLSLLLLALLALARHALLPIAGWTQTPLNGLNWVLCIWMPVYLLLMQKRVYRQGWPMTALKFSVIGICYSMLLSFALVAAVMLTLGRM